MEQLASKTGYKTTKSLEFLRDLVGRVQPKFVLELGTAFGGSAAYMASRIGNGKIVSIDNYDGLYASGANIVENDLIRLGLKDKVVLLKGNTHHSCKILSDAGISISPEIVFMDADHSYRGLVAEYKGFSTILPKEHIIIIDDFIASSDAQVFVSEMIRQYEFCTTIKSFHWGMAILCTNSGHLIRIASSVKEIST